MAQFWRPVLSDGPEPIYERLIGALRRDVGSGHLAAGTRLPPQRQLAHALGVSLGAVTRAYAEAEQRGLITAHVGRGSFVAPPPAPPDEAAVDLSRNLPPYAPARLRLAEAVARLPRMPGFLDAVGYAAAPGAPAHRAAMAKWLAHASGLAVAPERTVLTSGTQQGMALAFSAVCRAGDTVLCEAATFHGMKALAEHAGYRLQGLAMDAEGLIPDTLDAAAAGGPKVLYLLPTLQNPTGRTMSEARRREIAAVARRRGLWIVEDDVYGAYQSDAPPPLAAFAPDRSFFVTSLSKAVAPGLRAGAVVAPEGGGFEPALLRAVQALSIAGDPLGRMIAVRWIEDGTAAEIAREAAAEVTLRQALARAILGAAVEAPASQACPHLWLPMPELEAERIAGRALRAGVEVTAPAACAVDTRLVSGLRVCLGAAPDRPTLERGLCAVAEALSRRTETAARPLV